jgi:hypothetical protein
MIHGLPQADFMALTVHGVWGMLNQLPQLQSADAIRIALHANVTFFTEPAWQRKSM